MTSLAIRPRSPAAFAAAAWIHAPDAAARAGGTPFASSAADDAGQDVARARRGQPLVAVGDQETWPSGAATTVAGPFNSTTAPDVGDELSGRRHPVGTGRRPGEQGILAVVRRQHRGDLALGGGTPACPRRSTPARTTRRRRPPPAPPIRRRHGRPTAPCTSSRPRPGPTTRAWNRCRSASTASAQSNGRNAPVDHLDRRRRIDPRTRQRHHPGAGSAERMPPRRWAAPVIPGLPATMRTASVHLCAVRDRGRHTTPPRRRPRRSPVRVRRRVEADVGHLDVAHQVGAGAEHVAPA